MASWIIKCKKQADYKKAEKAFKRQNIPFKVKYEEAEDKKIKHIKVSQKYVDFADTIYFTLDSKGIDFTLYEKEKGYKATEVTQHSCEEMDWDDDYEM